MTRLAGIFWLLLVVAAGFTTFKVKYAVQDLEDQLARARKQTVAEQQEIRVLTAEWTYLNQPERLADLNKRFLGLGPIAAKQLQHRIEDIPLRPPAAPEAEAVVAAAPAPPPAAPAAAVASAGPIPALRARPPAMASAVPAPAQPIKPQAVASAAAPSTAASAVEVAAKLLAIAPAHAAAAAPAVAAAPRPAVRLATMGQGSLDALIAHIAETR